MVSSVEEMIALRWDTTPEHVRDLKDGTYVLSHRLMFHWMMVRGFVDMPMEYFDRWCYATKELVDKSLADFVESPPADYEPVGWHRHPPTHRRRVDGDPALEYIDP